MGNTRTVIPQMLLKDFFFFTKLVQVEILDKADSFLPAFLHIVNMGSSKYRFLSIVNPSNFSFLLSQILVSPMLAHKVSYHVLLQVGDTCLHLISCNYFQTIQ